jgi:transposase InsO family protein
VSRAGFYAWLKREPSAHARRDAELKKLVTASHDESRRTYGSPRVHQDLVEAGERVSRKRVARLMREQDLVARRRRRYRVATVEENQQPVPDNLLERAFTAEGPNRRWVGDTTELAAPGGRLFLAVLLDLYSRMVVGWAISAVNDRHLVVRALTNALQRRRPAAHLLHHTDQGSPYASEDYQRILRDHGVTSSMSRRGNCHDNAVAEAFFATLKAELGERFESGGDANDKLFDYIEVFYNRKRRHSTVGNVSPSNYERQQADQKAAA